MVVYCTICRHPKREEIEATIRSGLAYDWVARQFQVSHWAVRRHGRVHMGLRRRPRKGECTICSHPARQEIDAAIKAGASYGWIGRKFQVSEAVVNRHAVLHLGLRRQVLGRNLVKFGTALDADVLAALKAEAARRGLTVADLIRETLAARFLPGLESVQVEARVKGPRASLHVMVDADVLAAIKAEAGRRGVSTSEVVRQALRERFGKEVGDAGAG